MEGAQERAVDESLGGPGVLDKYTAAGKVAQQAMAELLARLAPGADVFELTRWGNARIAELCKAHFPARKMERGVAFPVCVSPNEMLGNFAPLKGESVALREGDLVKVELGVQFDGFPVSLVHSAHVGEAPAKEVELLRAGYLAVLGAVKALGANRECAGLARMQQAVGRALGVNFLENSATTEVRRYLLQGGRPIFSQPRPGAKVEEFAFKANEIYAVEAIVSLGEGARAKASEHRTTVFRRNMDASAEPKTAAGRQFLRDVRDKYADMCFSINVWEDELSARLGATDCTNNGLIEAMPVTLERDRARVAHFRWTVGVCGKRLLVLAGHSEARLEAGPRPALDDETSQQLFDVSLDALTAKPARPTPTK